mmetsp:Transcript_27957/g.61181  ORF Transcript_27957/g.61181 Transcript_27957/m.61181 type:complete len:215 (+) Transcript_27957:497-1141(+)
MPLPNRLSVFSEPLNTLSASAMAWAPSSPMWLFCRPKLPSEPNTARASAMALAPSGPTLLLRRSRVFSEPLNTRSQSAIALAPSTPMLLLYKFSVFSEPLNTLSTSATFAAPSGPFLLAFKVKLGTSPPCWSGDDSNTPNSDAALSSCSCFWPSALISSFFGKTRATLRPSSPAPMRKVFSKKGFSSVGRICSHELVKPSPDSSTSRASAKIPS